MVKTRQTDFIRPSTLAAAMLLSVLLFAINAEAQKVERITMAGGPPTGVFGIFTTGIGTCLSKNVPNLDVSVAATGGSAENPRRVSAKEAEMDSLFRRICRGLFGLEKFKEKPLTDLRAIGLVFSASPT